jgi:hypothetical protein
LVASRLWHDKLSFHGWLHGHQNLISFASSDLHLLAIPVFCYEQRVTVLELGGIVEFQVLPLHHVDYVRMISRAAIDSTLVLSL